MKVVVNASPLIFLAKLNQVNLLNELFKEVYTTSAVEKEILVNHAKHPEALLLSNAFKEGKIKALNPKKYLLASASIHKGELSVLSLAKELNVENVLIDDFKAIKLAKTLGLKPVSTVFLIVKAGKEGLLSKKACLELIELLSANGYRISIALYEQIRKLILE